MTQIAHLPLFPGGTRHLHNFWICPSCYPWHPQISPDKMHLRSLQCCSALLRICSNFYNHTRAQTIRNILEVSFLVVCRGSYSSQSSSCFQSSLFPLRFAFVFQHRIFHIRSPDFPDIETILSASEPYLLYIYTDGYWKYLSSLSHSNEFRFSSLNPQVSLLYSSTKLCSVSSLSATMTNKVACISYAVDSYSSSHSFVFC